MTPSRNRMCLCRAGNPKHNRAGATRLILDVSGYFRKMIIWAIKQHLVSEPACVIGKETTGRRRGEVHHGFGPFPILPDATTAATINRR